MINQIQPWINDDEANYVKEVLKKKYLTESKETIKFENNLKKKFKTKNAITVSNWTNGIFLLLKAAGIKKGDEVIVPNLTFIASVTPIIWTGATPVLCDIDVSNSCLDLDKLKKLINRKTKCIIPVHLYGHCCDLRKLFKIINDKKILIIEDAAQAMGATYENKFLGTIGDMGGFSFYGNKIITTGEGGVIFFKNSKLKNKIYSLKNHGRKKKGIFKHSLIGYNFMFTEMQAAVGNIQLKKFGKILKKKEKIFSLYKNNLKHINQINFLKPIEQNKPVHWFTNIIVKNKKKLKEHLYKNGIQTRDFFLPLNNQPCFLNTRLIKNINSKFPVSEYLYKCGLSLPSSYELTEKQIFFISEKIKEFYSKPKKKYV
jgi:perosamine synthetase